MFLIHQTLRNATKFLIFKLEQCKILSQIRKYDATSLQTSCTIFYIYYTKLLHVSAIYPGHFQGVTSLVDVYSVYGLHIWLKHVGVLYNKCKNTMQLLVVKFSYIRLLHGRCTTSNIRKCNLRLSFIQQKKPRIYFPRLVLWSSSCSFKINDQIEVLFYEYMTVLEQKHITGKAPTPILQDLANNFIRKGRCIV